MYARLHKIKVEQSPGWQDPILRWCADEAKKQGFKPQDYWGGFVIDEMKIQVQFFSINLFYLTNTVEPPLSGHPLLSGQLSKSRNYCR